MYVLELVFDDDQRRLDARPAHREILDRLHEDGVLVMAGPWADDSGALLIFSTDERGMRDIIATDPYYTTSGVTVAAVRSWKPITGAADQPVPPADGPH
jgi:uncharacterized protein YciI